MYVVVRTLLGIIPFQRAPISCVCSLNYNTFALNKLSSCLKQKIKLHGFCLVIQLTISPIKDTWAMSRSNC